MAKKKKEKMVKQMESPKDTLSSSGDSVPLHWYFIVVLFIFAVTIGVYWNTLENEFLTFDDKKYIYQNTLVTGDEGVVAIWADLFNDKPKLHYYPLTFTTFWLEHKLVGLSPKDANIKEAVIRPAHPLYHVDQMILHALNAVLVFFTLRALRIGFPIAAFTAIFFAIHPVNVASVAWMSERKNLVSGVFFWLTLLLYIRHRRYHTGSNVYSRKKTPWFYVSSLLTCLFALTAKAATVVLAPIIIITDRLLDRRWTWRSLLRSIPFFLLAVVFAINTTSIEAKFMATHWQHWPPIKFMLRPLIAVSAIIHYLAKMLLPVKQALLYPRWPDTFFNPRFWISLAIFIAAIELIRRNRRRLGAHWLWASCLFIITVAPVLSLKHFGWSQFSFVSDHYMYYGSSGVILMIGILLAKWTGIPVLSTDSADTGKPGIDKKRLFIVTACCLIALIACGVRTVQLNRTWKNNVTFSEQILKINPDSSVANSNLGHYYYREKDYERALLYYREWARIYPEYYKSWRACARTAAELHRVEETIGYYKQAIMAVDSRIPRGWWKIRTEYAEYLTYIGWISEAINEYQGIIEKQPPNRKYLEKTVKGLRKRLRKSPSGK